MTSPVSYTANGNWKPTIPDQVCEECGVTYTAHKRDQHYCGRSCATKANMRKRFGHIHTERTCPGCGKVWVAPPSNPSRYCSKQCIFDSGAWRKPKKAKCPQCGDTFMAHWKTDHWQKLCGKDCGNKALRNSIAKDCAQCGKPFTVQQSRKDETTCSQQCRDAFWIRDRHHGWKGGVVAQNDRRYRRIDREGYAAKYEGEHRLIAEREIGRKLVRGEAVLCLGMNHENLDPANLFLCPNARELGFILCGTVEWPSASNLEDYRVNGYVRPNVIVVLHEWENGRRHKSGRGRPITRHPQADEIIKRRRAGASVRELAAEFGTSMSGMAETIRSRL